MGVCVVSKDKKAKCRTVKTDEVRTKYNKIQKESGLRRGSSADRLLKLRVRIPQGALMFVLRAVGKGLKATRRAVKTKTQVRMKYNQ
jgi:hypothetical protein